MSVDRVLDRVMALRAAGTLGDPGGLGNNSDVLVQLLWEFHDRQQLDRMVDGLSGGVAVADRAETVLRLTGPLSASTDEIEAWGYACLQEWVSLAQRRCTAGPVLDAFEALGGMAIEVVDQGDRSQEASFRLNGSLLGKPAIGSDGELTSAQLAVIHEQTFELLIDEMTEGEPDDWDEISILFSAVLQDEPTLGGWLLSPASSWEFDFEPFYNLWRAGFSLWVSPDRIEAVQGSAIWDESQFGTAPVASGVRTDADAAWLQNSGPGGEEALALIAQRISTGGRSLELIDFGLSSLPPGLVVEGGWKLLNLSKNAGIDLARLSALAGLDHLIIRYCELESFDLVMPSDLRALDLYKNWLTIWPSNLAASADVLQSLNLQYNQLTAIPDDVASLTALNKLDIGSNALTTVSPAIGQLSNLERLSLSGNRELEALPAEVLDLPLDCRLSLFGTALPKSFHKAKTIAQLRDVWGDL